MLIVTRFKVTDADMDTLEALTNLRVTLFTYSGITDSRVEPIAKSSITTQSIRTACARKRRTRVMLYWRPIVRGWNDQPGTMAHVLRVGEHADAIVFTGCYHKPEHAAYLREQGVELPYGDADYHRRKAFPAELDAAVVTAWRASGSVRPLAPFTIRPSRATGGTQRQAPLRMHTWSQFAHTATLFWILHEQVTPSA